jgi:hypothetical protein
MSSTEMPNAIDSERYEANALYCDQATRDQESVVRASLQREQELCAQEEGLSELADKCLEYYEDFRMWEAKKEAEWSKTPDQYDANLHIDIKKIASLWCSILRRMVNYLDELAPCDLSVRGEEKIKAHYRVLVSIEMMDHGAMPEHIRRLADQARADYDAGKTGEMND